MTPDNFITRAFYVRTGRTQRPHTAGAGRGRELYFVILLLLQKNIKTYQDAALSASF